MNAIDLHERRPSWQASAACRGMGTDIFFLERGSNANEAKAVCGGCPVRKACADSGLMDDFGVWGGQSQRECQHTRVELGATSGHRHDRPVGCGTRNGLWAHRKAGETPCEECLAGRRADDRRRAAKLRARKVAA